MRAFISYSVADKDWGARVKTALESLGVGSFLAHDDMQVSELWRDRIIEELREVDIFVAILSSSFRSSEWCSQEVGFIISRPEVTLVPLTIDGTTPYGFMSALQGRRISQDREFTSILSEALFRHRPRELIPRQIRKMRDATSFRRAEEIVRPLVPHFRQFTDDEVIAFADAAAANSEVWDAWECRSKFIPEFVSVNGRRVPEDQRKALLNEIEELEFPR